MSASETQTSSVPFAQLHKLNYLLAEVSGRNPFYTRKWREAGWTEFPLRYPEQFTKLPFTTRDELIRDQIAFPPLGANRTSLLHHYKRIHRSSGTTGAPLFWGDTAQSWQWLLHCSKELYVLAGITSLDTLFFAVPFGQSLGPWIMYEGAQNLGCCALTGGRQNAEEEFQLLESFRPSVLVGKPSYLLQLGRHAEERGVSPRTTGVKKLIFTGESGIPLVRPALESIWDAECFNRYGLTEIGSVASECSMHTGGLHVLDEVIAESVSPETGDPAPAGESGELVLTNLGRLARPLIRYRTGDYARVIHGHECACGRTGTFIEGPIYRLPEAGVPLEGAASEFAAHRGVRVYFGPS